MHRISVEIAILDVRATEPGLVEGGDRPEIGLECF
jgi:hypothetical protein